MHYRYHTEFDIVLFDDAAQCIEPHTIVPLMYNPKVFLLFGDRNMRHKDKMNLEKIYQNANLTQSLFQRLFNNDNKKIVMNMFNQHRFSRELNSFFFENIWINNNNILGDVLSDNEEFPLKNFHIFNQTNDDFMENFCREIISFRDNKYSFGIVCPPNRE